MSEETEEKMLELLERQTVALEAIAQLLNGAVVEAVDPRQSQITRSWE